MSDVAAWLAAVVLLLVLGACAPMWDSARNADDVIEGVEHWYALALERIEDLPEGEHKRRLQKVEECYGPIFTQHEVLMAVWTSVLEGDTNEERLEHVLAALEVLADSPCVKRLATGEGATDG